MKRVKSIVSLAVAALVSATVSAQTMDDLNAKYNEAGKAMTERNFADAVKGFEEVIAMGQKIGPESLDLVQKSQGYVVDSYFRLGGTQAQAKEYEAALVSLTKSSDMAELVGKLPEKARAGQMLSQVYMVMGADAYNNERYGEAAEVFAMGYAAFPGNAQLALNLANSYDKIDSLQKAVSVYQGVMKLTQPAQAQNAAKAKEDLTAMLLERASKAGSANNLDEVVALTGTILEFDPQNSSANFLRLQTANNVKKYADAIKYAQGAIDSQTDPALKATAYFFLGSAQQNQGNNAAATAAFRNVTSGPYVAQAKQAITDMQ